MKFYPADSHLFTEFQNTPVDNSDGINVYTLKSWNTTNPSKSICAEDSLNPKDLINVVFEKGIHHLVQKKDFNFLKNLMSAADLVKHPEKYFAEKYCFLDCSNFNYQKLYISSKFQKHSVLGFVHNYVSNFNSYAISHAAISVSEELFTNAILDAPREHLSKEFTSESSYYSTMAIVELFHDDQFLQISCSDFYGSLNIAKLVRRMNEVYQKGLGDAIDLQSKQGAGIGCCMILEHCSDLIFGVKSGVQTKVTGIIPLRLSHRQRSKLKKTFHGFTA